MDANAISVNQIPHFGACLLDHTRYFMPWRQWPIRCRSARAVMRVRMANTRRHDSHQNIARPNLRHRNFLQYQWTAWFNQA
jgi:hypothetical protein